LHAGIHPQRHAAVPKPFTEDFRSKADKPLGHDLILASVSGLGLRCLLVGDKEATTQRIRNRVLPRARQESGSSALAENHVMSGTKSRNVRLC
jgi:hypothetical protein